MTTRLLVGDVTTLPAVLTTKEAAELLGVSVDHLWSLARTGEAPVEPLKLGRSYRWPTRLLLDRLGFYADEPSDRTEGSVTNPLNTAKHQRRSGAG